MLDLTGRKKKHLSGVQAFYHLYYDSLLRPLVLEKWQQEEDYDPDVPDPTFEYRNTTILALWKAAPEETKERVKAYIEKEHEWIDGVDEDEDNEEWVADDHTPEEKAQVQANRRLQM